MEMIIIIMRVTTVFFFCQSNCVQNPCKNIATCQSGFTRKGYRCLCTAGFEGPICDRGKHNFYVDILRPSVKQQRGKTLPRCLLIGSQRMKKLFLSSSS